MGIIYVYPQLEHLLSYSARLSTNLKCRGLYKLKVHIASVGTGAAIGSCNRCPPVPPLGNNKLLQDYLWKIGGSHKYHLN